MRRDHRTDFFTGNSNSIRRQRSSWRLDKSECEKVSTFFLTHFRELRSRESASHLAIVGERYSAKEEAIEFENILRATASHPPLGGRVHFLGVRSDVSRLMNEATLLVHAARQEPLGRVLLEAMSTGTPTVATEVGGTAEILASPSLREFLVPPADPTQLSKRILDLLSDDTQNANSSPKSCLVWPNGLMRQTAAKKLDAFYRSILSESSTR